MRAALDAAASFSLTHSDWKRQLEKIVGRDVSFEAIDPGSEACRAGKPSFARDKLGLAILPQFRNLMRCRRVNLGSALSALLAA
jgi:hypothetical protein